MKSSEDQKSSSEEGPTRSRMTLKATQINIDKDNRVGMLADRDKGIYARQVATEYILLQLEFNTFSFKFMIHC